MSWLVIKTDVKCQIFDSVWTFFDKSSKFASGLTPAIASFFSRAFIPSLCCFPCILIYELTDHIAIFFMTLFHMSWKMRNIMNTHQIHNSTNDATGLKRSHYARISVARVIKNANKQDFSITQFRKHSPINPQLSINHWSRFVVVRWMALLSNDLRVKLNGFDDGECWSWSLWHSIAKYVKITFSSTVAKSWLIFNGPSNPTLARRVRVRRTNHLGKLFKEATNFLYSPINK